VTPFLFLFSNEAEMSSDPFSVLSQLEQENPGAHFVSRHGAGTTIDEQWIRAESKLTPDGIVDKVQRDASRFFSNRAQLEAAQEAERIFQESGKSFVQFNMGKIVGEGFEKGGNKYVVTSNVAARFRDGKLYTLYPLLNTLP
jgi:hypothetical protein